MPPIGRFAVGILLTLVTTLPLSCAKNTSQFVPLKGRVVENGAEPIVKGKAPIVLQFIAFDTKDYLIPPRITGALPESKYSFSLEESKGLVSKITYKILLSANDDPTQNRDVFNGAFNEVNTPLTFTPTDSASQEIEVDFAKRTVTLK